VHIQEQERSLACLAEEAEALRRAQAAEQARAQGLEVRRISRGGLCLGLGLGLVEMRKKQTID
jgi:hypothetical protein